MKYPAGDEAVLAWTEAVRKEGGPVSAERAALLGQFVKELKGALVWERLDRLWIFAAENKVQARIDLIALAPAILVNDPIFIAGKGFVFDGATQYVDTGFNGAGHPAAKYTVNSASFGGFLFAGAQKSGGMEFGNDYGGYSMMVTRWGNKRRFQINARTDNSEKIEANGVWTGHFHGQRTAFDRTELYLDGVLQGVSRDVSAEVPNKVFSIGAYGSRNLSHSNAAVSTAHIGASFSPEQVQRFDRAIRSFVVAASDAAQGASPGVEPR